jgi:hypothetical protein
MLTRMERVKIPIPKNSPSRPSSLGLIKFINPASTRMYNGTNKKG